MDIVVLILLSMRDQFTLGSVNCSLLLSLFVVSIGHVGVKLNIVVCMLLLLKSFLFLYVNKDPWVLPCQSVCVAAVSNGGMSIA